MPVQIIGEFGTPGASREWISAQATLAIRFIIEKCGPPPPEMELEVQWQEHELGSYPLIVLTWEDGIRGAPWTYISRCEAALTAYENNGELPPGWSNPRAFSDDEDGLDDEALYSDEAPDPPDALNVFEFQRYVGKLTEWALESHKPERNEPKVVERDDDEPEES